MTGITPRTTNQQPNKYANYNAPLGLSEGPQVISSSSTNQRRDGAVMTDGEFWKEWRLMLRWVVIPHLFGVENQKGFF